jgi:hypothetical protein
MALKKRVSDCDMLRAVNIPDSPQGFNVDRILNQQREERLRVQAENIRDREKAAEAAAAISGSDTVKDYAMATKDSDAQSLRSVTSVRGLLKLTRAC